eukprot:COSAG05_NODE_8455_length_702_cov_0.913765_1_plen_34_part_10
MSDAAKENLYFEDGYLGSACVSKAMFHLILGSCL